MFLRLIIFRQKDKSPLIFLSPANLPVGRSGDKHPDKTAVCPAFSAGGQAAIPVAIRMSINSCQC